MAQNRLTSSPLSLKQGGTGRDSLAANGLLYGLGSGNLLGALSPGALGDMIALKGGQPSSVPGDRILQVVMGTTATETRTTDLVNWVPTTLSALITPFYADSNILVLVNQSGVGKTVGSGFMGLSLWRGVVNLGVFGYPLGWTGESTQMSPGTASHTFLDAPATVSALTYSTKALMYNGAGEGICQWASVGNVNNGTSSMILLEVASS